MSTYYRSPACKAVESNSRVVAQERIQFKKRKRTNGIGEVAKLVYKDNTPMNRVVKSDTLQSWYRRLKFDGITTYSLYQYLQEEYVRRISVSECDIVSSRAFLQFPAQKIPGK